MRIDILVVTYNFFIADQTIIKKPVKLELIEGGILYRNELNDDNLNDEVLVMLL